MGKNIEQRVTELEKMVKKLADEKGVKFRKKLEAGDTFEAMGLTWTILKITEKGYMCLADCLEESKRFGSDNDWKNSNIRAYLNVEFYEKLAEEVGGENIILFERDLLSMDGQAEYGTCEDYVSLISFDEYRENRSLIPNAGYWWWTLTPDSTECNGDSSYIRVVSPSGLIGCNCYYDGFGGRPFCIFSSSLFESEEE